MQKALANEVDPPPEGISQRSCSGFTAFQGAEGAELAPLPPTARLEASERVFTPWQHPFTTGATVQEAWTAAFHQMELQFDRASFDWLRSAHAGGLRALGAPLRRGHPTRICPGDVSSSGCYRSLRRILVDVLAQPGGDSSS